LQHKKRLIHRSSGQNSLIYFWLTKEQFENRQMLTDSIKQAGFIALRHEWWHFDGMQKELARNKYKIIE